MTLSPELKMVGQPAERTLSSPAKNLFIVWTLFWWSIAGVCAVLFYVGTFDFLVSTKLSLYGISIWLNGWILAYFLQKSRSSKMDLYHDCLVVWMLSYALTNVLWEMPWVILSPIIFENLNTIEDVLAYTPYMRESILNMYWWTIASFGSVDLRTVNGDGAFYAVEIYAFVNFFTTLYFFYLNSKRSPYRYLVVILSCGEPIAATFIFSFSEVFDHFANMPGGIADTLLALVWTQYQYFFFPMVFSYMGYKLLMEDWKQCYIATDK